MQVSVIKEDDFFEKRAPVIPDAVSVFAGKGMHVGIEKGLGEEAGFSDEDYIKAGAKICADRKLLISMGDIIIRIGQPSVVEIRLMKKGALHISFLDPFFEKELIDAMCYHGINSISLEMIPRSTKAQYVDVLSSQSSLSGYAAIVFAAAKIRKVFPMMMTPSGTIKPVRVLVIGAGVMGLQAIATAKRLGAVVAAYDTRKASEEEVTSLGAKFISLDLQDKSTKEGYAKQLNEEEKTRQHEALKKYVQASDIVLTTANVFGKKPPLIITFDMMNEMKKDSLIIDLSAAKGGNVEGSSFEEKKIGKARVIGIKNPASLVAFDASLMFSSNIKGLISMLWNQNDKKFEIDLNNDVIKGALVTYDGQTIHPALKKE